MGNGYEATEGSRHAQSVRFGEPVNRAGPTPITEPARLRFPARSVKQSVSFHPENRQLESAPCHISGREAQAERQLSMSYITYTRLVYVAILGSVSK